MINQLYSLVILCELAQFKKHIILFEYAILTLLLIGALLICFFLLSTQTKSLEKRTSYECGFAPFGDARMQMNIHFYLIGILYLIFDLELVFFYPWIYSFSVFFNSNAFFVMITFIVLLGIGFIYEWLHGVFQWTRVK
jgi:NADH-quinone oxidoreductase subunit A